MGVNITHLGGDYRTLAAPLESTGWLPHHWQLLQTGPEMPNFDENKKVRHVLCIEF